MSNKQKYCLLMNFNTGEEVSLSWKKTELPVNDVIIKAVEYMASPQTMKRLQIKILKKFIYHPANWVSVLEKE